MGVKSLGSTEEWRPKLPSLREVEVSGTNGGAVNALISLGTPEAKAAYWAFSDAEARKLGERTGLDTPVVLAVNDEHWIEGTFTSSRS